jgi:hypothetical protein
MAVKKIIVSFLAFVILLVSCIPCADKGSFSQTGGDTIEIVKTSSDQNNNIDVCPPFCSCNCCSTYTVSDDPQPEFPIIYNAAVYAFYYSNVLSVSDPSIWQPPRAQFMII